MNDQKKRPYTCPACKGHKTTQKPPWVAGDQETWMSSDTRLYKCRTCNDTGLIWETNPVIINNTATR